MPRTFRRFEFTCQKCGRKCLATCPDCRTVFEFDPLGGKKETLVMRLRFNRMQWARIAARAAITPGVGSAAEWVRLACEDVLASGPGRLL